jgi:hypothetical protein
MELCVGTICGDGVLMRFSEYDSMLGAFLVSLFLNNFQLVMLYYLMKYRGYI